MGKSVPVFTHLSSGKLSPKMGFFRFSLTYVPDLSHLSSVINSPSTLETRISIGSPRFVNLYKGF